MFETVEDILKLLGDLQNSDTAEYVVEHDSKTAETVTQFETLRDFFDPESDLNPYLLFNLLNYFTAYASQSNEEQADLELFSDIYEILITGIFIPLLLLVGEERNKFIAMLLDHADAKLHELRQEEIIKRDLDENNRIHQLLPFFLMYLTVLRDSSLEVPIRELSRKFDKKVKDLHKIEYANGLPLLTAKLHSHFYFSLQMITRLIRFHERTGDATINFFNRTEITDKRGETVELTIVELLTYFKEYISDENILKLTALYSQRVRGMKNNPLKDFNEYLSVDKQCIQLLSAYPQISFAPSDINSLKKLIHLKPTYIKGLLSLSDESFQSYVNLLNEYVKGNKMSQNNAEQILRDHFEILSRAMSTSQWNSFLNKIKANVAANNRYNKRFKSFIKTIDDKAFASIPAQKEKVDTSRPKIKKAVDNLPTQTLKEKSELDPTFPTKVYTLFSSSKNNPTLELVPHLYFSKFGSWDDDIWRNTVRTISGRTEIKVFNYKGNDFRIIAKRQGSDLIVFDVLTHDNYDEKKYLDQHKGDIDISEAELIVSRESGESTN